VDWHRPSYASMTFKDSSNNVIPDLTPSKQSTSLVAPSPSLPLIITHTSSTTTVWYYYLLKLHRAAVFRLNSRRRSQSGSRSRSRRRSRWSWAARGVAVRRWSPRCSRSGEGRRVGSWANGLLQTAMCTDRHSLRTNDMFSSLPEQEARLSPTTTHEANSSNVSFCFSVWRDPTIAFITYYLVMNHVQIGYVPVGITIFLPTLNGLHKQSFINRTFCLIMFENPLYCVCLFDSVYCVYVRH